MLLYCVLPIISMYIFYICKAFLSFFESLQALGDQEPLITISLSNFLPTIGFMYIEKQRIKSNCYWKHLYTIEQQYICYVHLQLFNQTSQH